MCAMHMVNVDMCMICHTYYVTFIKLSSKKLKVVNNSKKRLKLSTLQSIYYISLLTLKDLSKDLKHINDSDLISHSQIPMFLSGMESFFLVSTKQDDYIAINKCKCCITCRGNDLASAVGLLPTLVNIWSSSALPDARVHGWLQGFVPLLKGVGTPCCYKKKKDKKKGNVGGEEI